mmetsp:Transcript_80723/g.250568  ORF Transcript_80723/g.250568 Transcript_80723/m.250568 type:complete len:244 (+) Transcript_80723:17-748(+)
MATGRGFPRDAPRRGRHAPTRHPHIVAAPHGRGRRWACPRGGPAALCVPAARACTPPSGLAACPCGGRPAPARPRAGRARPAAPEARGTFCGDGPGEAPRQAAGHPGRASIGLRRPAGRRLQRGAGSPHLCRRFQQHCLGALAGAAAPPPRAAGLPAAPGACHREGIDEAVGCPAMRGLGRVRIAADDPHRPARLGQLGLCLRGPRGLLVRLPLDRRPARELPASLGLPRGQPSTAQPLAHSD